MMVLIPTEATHGRAPAASQRPVPAPCRTSHRQGSRLTRHQRGFKQFTRPIFPSPVAARMERATLGLKPRASHPADQEPTTHAEVGTGHRARTWNYRSTQLTSVDLQSSSSLNACDLVSHVAKGIATTTRASKTKRSRLFCAVTPASYGARPTFFSPWTADRSRAPVGCGCAG